MLITTADHASFLRSDGSVAIRDFTWRWQSGEAWAIVGGTGSGKTTLLEGLIGRLRCAQGSVEWHAKAEFVAFKEQPRGHVYYQQRYEYADADEPLSLQQYLGRDADPLFEKFGLTNHLPQPFITLSNGQMRKARIAKALLKNPEVLILDDPFLGLDGEARKDLAELVNDRMLIACRSEDLPAHITHVIHMDEMRISSCGRRAGRGFASPAWSVEEQLPKTRGSSRVSQSLDPPYENPVVELRNVTVRHGGRVILDDVSWTVRRGERWALTGPNGAGKTTLLSLVVGDHPQAFSNDVRLFGNRRGSGETVWDIRRRVGFVSPEFHLYFAEDLTAAEAAETGFTDTLLHHRVTEQQAAAVRELFADLGLAHLADQRMRRLSTGQQRLALVVRALVKRPPLLVLDEPTQGLDTAILQKINAWLMANLTEDQTLIMTTHRMEELPPIIDRHLHLRAGRTDP